MAAQILRRSNPLTGVGMTEIEIEAFHDSFGRCMAHPRFFDLFYDDFLGSSLEVKQKFQQTDFARQKRMLRLSLLLVMNAAVHKANDFSFLESTAIRHSRSAVNIPPHL